MAIQGLSETVQDRVATVNRQTQDVMQAYFNTTRQFYDVVFSSAQMLVEAEYAATKDWVEATNARLRAARTGGMEQIAFVPAELLPLMRQHWFRTYEDVRQHVSRSREELLDVMREGYRSVWTSLSAGDELAGNVPAAAQHSAGEAAPEPAPSQPVAAMTEEAKPAEAKTSAEASTPEAKTATAQKRTPAARPRRKTAATRKASGASGSDVEGEA